MNTLGCPPREELERLLDEQLSAADFRRVSDHVAACPVCQQALETLTADADSDPGSGQRRSSPDSAAAHSDVIDRIKQAAPSTPRPWAAAADDASPGAEDAEVDAPPSLDDYEILGVLGRGAEGVVYQARHRPLGRIVALKVLRDAALAQPQSLQRFRLEAETLAKLRHPNIVQVYEVGSQAGRPFFAMECVDGGTLGARLRGQPEPPRAAAELVESLALAIHAAHESGVVHRDLKPANVLLAQGTPGAGYGVPKITDFGLAKRFQADSSLTRTGMVLGTPAYMAPEQARAEGKDVGPACDVYSLGSILYHLLTGRPPFVGARPMDVLLQLVHDDPVAPRRLFPQAPRDLETICLKCLHKDPRRRYASAAALADDLRRCLDGRSVQARPTPAWERAWKAARRRPVMATLLAACTAALLLLLGGALYYNAQLADAKKQSDDNARDAGIAQRKADAEAGAARTAEKKAGVEADAARTAGQAAQASAVEAERQRSLALEAYEKLISEVRDKLGYAEATKSMRQSLLKTAADGLKKMAQSTEGAATGRARAAALMKLGRILYNIQDDDGARAQFEACRSIAVNLVEANPHDGPARDLLCEAYSGLGNLDGRAGRTSKAMASFQQEADCAKKWLDDEPDSAGARERVAESYNWLAGSDADPYDLKSYEEFNDKLTDVVDRWLKADPRNARARYYQAATLHRAGRIHVLHGDPPTALDCFLRSKTLLDALTAEGANDLHLDESMMAVMQALSAIYVELGEPAKALPYATAQAEIYRSTLASGNNDPANVEFQYRCGDAYFTRAAVLMHLMRHEEAVKEMAEAVEVFRALEPRLKFGPLAAKVHGQLAQLQEEIEFCRAVPTALENPAFALAQSTQVRQDFLIIRVCLLTQQGRTKEADQAIDLVDAQKPDTPEDCYTLAYFLAGDLPGLTADKAPAAFTDADLAMRQRFIDRAATALNHAVDLGFRDVKRLQSDDSLWVLHQDPGFRAVIERLERLK